MSGCTSCKGFGITVALHCVLTICNKCCTDRVPRSWNHPNNISWSSCTLTVLSQMRFFLWFAILTMYANTHNECLEPVQMLDRARAYCVQYIEIMCMWYMWIVTRCWLDGWWQLIRSWCRYIFRTLHKGSSSYRRLLWGHHLKMIGDHFVTHNLS